MVARVGKVHITGTFGTRGPVRKSTLPWILRNPIRENAIHLELCIQLLDNQMKQKCLKTVSRHEVVVKSLRRNEPKF